MKIIFRLLLFVFSLLLVYSCKKMDETDPVIILLQPSSLLTISPVDTITVEATITDDRDLQEVSVQLLNLNFTPVSNIRKFFPTSKNFHLLTPYILSEPNLETGTYLIGVTVFDGNNTVHAYREIYVQALPNIRKSVFVITKNAAGNPCIFRPDSLHLLQAYLSIPGDYLSSSISSRDQKLYILGSTTGGFSAINPNTPALINSLPPLTPTGNPTFTYLDFKDGLNYIAFYDGNIRAFNEYLSQQFYVHQEGYFRPHALLKTDDYLYSENYYFNLLQNRIEVFALSTGQSLQWQMIDLNIVSMFEKSGDEIFIFGQKNGVAVLESYNRVSNSLQLIRTFGNYQINAVYQYRNNEYYLATSAGLIHYLYDQNQLSPLTTQAAQGINYDPLLNEFFLSENNIVRVIDGGSMTDKYTITATDSVVNVLFLYDR